MFKRCSEGRTKYVQGRALALSLGSSVLALGIALQPGQLQAQQLVANGTTQTALGTYNTGAAFGSAGYALWALNNGIITSASPLTLRTGGSNAYGAAALSAGMISIFSGSTIDTTATGSAGLFASGGTINASGTSITTSGSSAYGVSAETSGSVTLTNGSTITTSGSGAYGLRAVSFGAGQIATIDSTGAAIVTSAGSTHGAFAGSFGQLVLRGGSIKTTGTQADGIFAFGGSAPARVQATGVAVSTRADQSNGAEANVNGNISLSGGSVTTAGQAAYGIYTIGGGVLGAEGVSVSTGGSSAHGAYALQGQMTLTNVAVSTTGSGAYGAGVDNASSLTMTGGSVTTSNASSFGAIALSRSTLNATSATIVTNGPTSPGVASEFGAAVTLTGGTVTTNGNGSNGLLSVGLSSGTGASIGASGVTVTTKGSSSHGTVVRSGSSITLTGGSVVEAKGAGSAAIFSSAYDTAPSTLTATNSSLTSDQGVGAYVTATTLNATLTNSSLSGVNLSAAVNGATLNLTAASSRLSGNALTDATSTTNYVLPNASLWSMTDSSVLTSLSNDASTINFTAPAGDPTVLASYKTLSVANYRGVNGTIGLNTYLGDDGSASDRVVINGGAGTGTTALVVSNTTGGGAQTVADGILVVDAQNGATTTTDAFSLGNRVAAGAYDYSLFRGGASNANSWFLRSVFVPPPAPPGPPVPPGPTPPAPLPDIRPEVPADMVLPVLAQRMGLDMLGTYRDRVGEDYPDPMAPAGELFCKDAAQNYRCTPSPEQAAAYAGAATRRMAGWGRIFGETGQAGFGDDDPAASLQGSLDHGPSYDFHIWGLQAGMDILRAQHEDGSRDIAGLYLGYGRGTADVDGIYGGDAGSAEMNAYSFGGYWTHFGAPGWYVDAVLQGTRYDQAEAGSVKGETLDTSGWGIAASLEAGYPFALGQGWKLEPSAQLIYQHVTLDDENDSFALISIADSDAVYGRAGARLARDWMTDSNRRMTGWVSANVWSSFGARAETTFAGLSGENPTTFGADLGNSWGSLGLGLSAEVARNVRLFATGNYNVGFSGGDSWSVGGNVGLKVVW